MNKTILYILFVCLFVCPAWALYTYEVYTYGESKTLHNEETILVDLQGGMPELALFESSSATIKGTSDLGSGTGGIELISTTSTSTGHLEMTGGEVGIIDIDGNFTAVFKGGLIGEIRIDQLFFLPEGIPHITLYYSGDLPTLNTSSLLTGLWGNGNSFDIHLVNDTGVQCDLLDNFNFVLVPEPATLALLGLGALALRKRKR